MEKRQLHTGGWLAAGLLMTLLATFAAGAETHWAFRPPVRPGMPSVRNAVRIRTPIDAFVLARLEATGQSFAPEADRRTLIRRATFDLIGLPPTPLEVDAFLTDPSPDAYERLIDRLLASAHYGERWGRHWLDVAGYADTLQSDNDFGIVNVHEGMWRYRDWVVQNINGDRPFDRFLTEQLAGDELIDWRTGLPAAARELLIATSFLRNAIDNTNEMELNRPLDRDEVLIRTMELVGSGLLGLTLECCRCHDHKFDPIPQQDYYRLKACFTPAYNPARWRQPRNRYLVLNVEPHQLAGAVVALVTGRHQPGLRLAAAAQVRAAATRLETEKFPALWEDGPPPETHVLKRGSVSNPGPAVEPGFLRVLGTSALSRPAHTRGATSGRRLALARWLTAPHHPLTARLYVNRLWMHHFGRGLVATPDNFGTQGSPPSHPELLDWLAREFMDGGWTTKRLHRLLMTSTVYRQSSAVSESRNPQALELLSRMPLRRLEAEAVRDAVLATSGRLDRTVGGPPVPLDSRPDGLTTVSAKAAPPGGPQRRSLYVLARRNYPVSLLDAFDFPLMSVNCTRRTNTATPLQSLHLLNSEFVAAQAAAFADRVAAATGPDLARQVTFAFRLVLARPPSKGEINDCAEHLRTQAGHFRAAGEPTDRADRRALAGLCQMLFCTNEFLYVD
jgi:hypothetical protein